MSDAIESAKPAIARVSFAGDPKRSGTAFLIGDKHAVTALHVVANKQTSPLKFRPGIELTFPGAATAVAAEVVPDFWSLECDWVVLKLDTSLQATPIEFGTLPARDSAWLSFGYPQFQSAGMLMGGAVRDPHALVQIAGGRSPRLQLRGDEASAGTGPPLHGYSGAPCLVDGKAVGILCSTLMDEFVDGEQQRHLFTRAGTVYASPCEQIVQWQVARRRCLLDASWAPSAEMLEDFIVVLSTHEPDDSGGVTNDKWLPLRDVVRQARRTLKSESLAQPSYVSAAEVVGSRQRLESFVQAMCRAKVVLFDASSFEPAVMFLAGIRAVCRRGLTLLSVGGTRMLGDDLGVPFNVKDANIVVHSNQQAKSAAGDSVTLLAERLRRGLRELGSAQYLDLPVFDAVRLLPADRRGIIPQEEGVLVLCAFDPKAKPFWTRKLKPALDHELRSLRQGDARFAAAPQLGVARSFELNSPRLVTQAVYEAIRRAQACVVDLSGWSPNVLFELGVRLVASGGRTVCLIEKDWLKKVRPAIRGQCEALAELVTDHNFAYDPAMAMPWEKQQVFSNAYGADNLPTPALLQEAALHTLVERSLDLDAEPASCSVHEELRAQAALFSRTAGRTKPVGLFPGNVQLTEREEAAEFERLVAAWLYLSHRYEPQELLANDVLCAAVEEVSTDLFARHDGRLSSRMKDDLSKLADLIDSRSPQ